MSLPTPQLVRLPAAPRNGSPVPELTSLHTEIRRGPYGDRRYRGNCGGYLIRDLLRYFGADRVLDLMSGSGTGNHSSSVKTLPAWRKIPIAMNCCSWSSGQGLRPGFPPR